MRSTSEPKKNLDKHDANGPRTRRRGLGPGTWFALLLGAAVLVSQAWNQRRDPAANAGPIVYQTDSQGKMRPVSSHGTTGEVAVPVPGRRLWKPETGWLLEHDLKLSRAQRQAILVLDSTWRQEKTRLETALRDATASASRMVDHRREEHAGSLDLLKQGLGEYSAISRQYDARRADYWLRGVSLLSKAQRQKVEELSVSGESSTAGRAR